MTLEVLEENSYEDFDGFLDYVSSDDQLFQLEMKSVNLDTDEVN